MRKLEVFTGLVGVAGWLLCVSVAVAGPLPEGGVTGEEVVEVLQAKGYKAELTTDSSDDPMVRSGADGSNFTIYFYGCKGEPKRCDSIQFAAGFDLDDGMSAEEINTWNREHRFGRSYLDDEADPWVQMDVDVELGFTTEALASNIATWVAVLPRFKAFIGI